MNVFEFIEKYNLKGKKINERPWGSYELHIEMDAKIIVTPSVYGWGIKENIALAMFLTEATAKGYIGEMKNVLSKEAYDDLVSMEINSIDELFSVTSIKEEPVLNGITNVLGGENTSGAAQPFIRKWHYSKYADVQHRFCFGLFRPGKFLPEMIGAMIYSPPAGPSAAEYYLPDEPENCIELRRLCCVDDTPKNAESFFISKTIKWLKKFTTIKIIISYADPEFGHSGIIYKASNFEMIGMSSGATVLMVDGKKYHPRTLNQKERPYGREIKERWKNDDPDVEMIKTAPKYVYVYKIERKI